MPVRAPITALYWSIAVLAGAEQALMGYLASKIVIEAEWGPSV